MIPGPDRVFFGILFGALALVVLVYVVVTIVGMVITAWKERR